MELRGLRYFMVLAQELHFGRAAVRLNISQPPLTQHIKRLEADLGALLFERNNRSVRLTAAGTALLLETRRVIGDIDGLRRVVREAQSGEMGLLRAGFMSSAPFARARNFYGCLARDLPGAVSCRSRIRQDRPSRKGPMRCESVGVQTESGRSSSALCRAQAGASR
jgi:DNA-binding transcriptional LysR family regulator